MARNRQTIGRVAEAWQSRRVRTGVDNPARNRSGPRGSASACCPGGDYMLGYRRGGMLDDVSAALFVLGLAISLRRLRGGRDAFVPYWWLATVIAGGIMTVDSARRSCAWSGCCRRSPFLPRCRSTG